MGDALTLPAAMSNIFSLDFWFRLHPISLSPTFSRAFFVLFALFIIFGSIATMVARKRKEDMFLMRIYRKIAAMLTTMGWVGMMILFFSYEELYLLGARFWFLIWGLGVLAWIGSIVYYAKVHVPREREQYQSKVSANKYLPKRAR